MDLEEAREKATNLKNGDLDIPVCIAELINIIVALDNRITELEIESSKSEEQIDELEAKLIEQEIVEKEIKRLLERITELETQRDELLEALQNLLKAQSGNGKIFFKALKEAMAIVDKLKQPALRAER